MLISIESDGIQSHMELVKAPIGTMRTVFFEEQLAHCQARCYYDLTHLKLRPCCLAMVQLWLSEISFDLNWPVLFCSGHELTLRGLSLDCR